MSTIDSSTERSWTLIEQRHATVFATPEKSVSLAHPLGRNWKFSTKAYPISNVNSIPAAQITAKFQNRNAAETVTTDGESVFIVMDIIETQLRAIAASSVPSNKIGRAPWISDC